MPADGHEVFVTGPPTLDPRGYPFRVGASPPADVLSFLSGVLLISPESGKIGKLIEERGGVDAEIGARIERILLYSRVELALIALIAMDMILKPGL